MGLASMLEKGYSTQRLSEKQALLSKSPFIF